MTLPPPVHGITWTDYAIATPTFQLTPIEKADMSPFLVHMTGKSQIHSILKGENGPEDLAADRGYLRASVPEYNQGPYNARVVCFTESPSFALDFFRYRSFRRWQDDQRYGIGFDKGGMVAIGARPVCYLDDELIRVLLGLHGELASKESSLHQDDNVHQNVRALIDGMYPLVFPLCEDSRLQGFMWEREWRHPSSVGVTFSHSSIEVICCPEDEEEPIRDLLGDTVAGIDFIRAWREYDDVTAYLRRQRPIWQAQAASYRHASKAQDINRTIRRLDILIKQRTQALHSLRSYEAYIDGLLEVMERIQEERDSIEQELEPLQEELNELRQQQEQMREEEQEPPGEFAEIPDAPDPDGIPSW